MKAKFTRSGGFGDKKPQMGGRKETVKITDIVEMYDWPSKGGTGQVRPVGPIEGRGIHKIKVKKKDGTEVEISKACLAFNVETDERDTTKKCPYCKLPDTLAKFSKAYFFNVIDRRLVEEAPGKQPKHTAVEAKTGLKDINSKSWTPARVLRLPSGGALRLQSLGKKNLVKNTKTGDKKSFDANHATKGFDLDVSFDKSKPAANMYEIDRNQDEKFTPITEEEDGYLLWNVELVWAPEEFADAKKEADSLLERFGGAPEGSDDDDDDDDDDTPKSKKKPAKKRPAADDEDEEEEDEEEEEDLDLDDEEEDEPKSKKKPAAKKKKPADDEVEDEDEEDEEEDEDSDGDEDEDEDEEEDEPAPKKKASAKKPVKKKPADDEDEEEEDEEEEDEEDEPAPKKKAAAKKTSSKKKPADDEDDLDDLDDEDEEEEDEEEEDEPPKRAKAPAKKVLKKKSR